MSVVLSYLPVIYVSTLKIVSFFRCLFVKLSSFLTESLCPNNHLTCPDWFLGDSNYRTIILKVLTFRLSFWGLMGS